MTVTYHGYEDSELRAAFELVQHPKNWKFGNETDIPADKLAIVCAATIFFAGSPVTVLDADKTRARIKFAGYYTCIGA